MARGQERVRRWEAVLNDPAQMARRDPEEVLRGLAEARRFTRAWSERKIAVEIVVARLNARPKITYCESKAYRKKQREAAKAEEAI